MSRTAGWEYVIEEITKMLWDRVDTKGNVQGKHGREAEFEFEVFLFCQALSKLMDQQQEK